MCRFFLFFLLTIFLINPAFSDVKTNPVGFWNTKDDNTGKTLTIVQIWKTKENTYDGKIVKICPVEVDGVMQKYTDVCKECDGELKNKPFLGMQIMKDMKRDSGFTSPPRWDEGTVFDPKSGNTYSGYMELLNAGQKLKLRGYIGITLFGRTAYWYRTGDPKEKTKVEEVFYKPCQQNLPD